MVSCRRFVCMLALFLAGCASPLGPVTMVELLGGGDRIGGVPLDEFASGALAPQKLESAKASGMIQSSRVQGSSSTNAM